MLKRAEQRRRHPPGPGNTSHFLRLTWRHAFHLWWNPIDYVTRLGQRYGNITTFMLFGKRTYLINSPELIHQVLVSRSKFFIKQPRQMRVIRQTFGEGLLVTEGPQWLKQRRLLQKAFQSRYLDRSAEITAQRTQQMLLDWDQRNSPTLDLADEMGWLTMAATLESMFDVRDDRQARRLAEAIRVLSKVFIREIQALFVLPDWLPLKSKREKRRAQAELHAFLDQAIVRRGNSDSPCEDLLSLLLEAIDDQGDGTGMTDRQARDEAVTMLVAGNHTTSAALSWLWWLMGEHPTVQSRLAAEAREVLAGRTATLADLPRLPYAEQVIKESLRLYPPAWALFAREVAHDVQLGGYTMRRGAWVFIYPFVTHRDPRFFPRPLEFDPERFAPERIGEIPPHAYFPFGLGPHVCIGNRLSMMQMTLIVATIAQRYEFIRQEGQGPIAIEPHVAIRPLGGVPLDYRRRNA